MELADCPHCGMHVAFQADDICPSCRTHRYKLVEPSQRLPASQFVSSLDEPAPEMTKGEKAYSGVVIIFAALFAMSVASYYFIAIPIMEDPYVIRLLQIATAVMAVFAISLIVTVTLNLSFKSLLTAPTVIQCITFTLTIYLIPIAIWGAVLLSRQSKREKLAAESRERQTGTESVFEKQFLSS